MNVGLSVLTSKMGFEEYMVNPLPPNMLYGLGMANAFSLPA